MLNCTFAIDLPSVLKYRFYGENQTRRKKYDFKRFSRGSVSTGKVELLNSLKIWDMDSVGDIATVTVHIKKIREKIEANTAKPQYIETIWGVGYRFRV